MLLDGDLREEAPVPFGPHVLRHQLVEGQAIEIREELVAQRMRIRWPVERMVLLGGPFDPGWDYSHLAGDLREELLALGGIHQDQGYALLVGDLGMVALDTPVVPQGDIAFAGRIGEGAGVAHRPVEEVLHEGVEVRRHHPVERLLALRVGPL